MPDTTSAMPGPGQAELEQVLAGQAAYYRALAAEYSEHGLDLPGAAQLPAAIEAFGPAGDVLEIACGPGTWTAQLARHADTLTALDASAEMLAIAAGAVPSATVRFIQADIFSWSPERRYDVVFFGFWLSHVPLERFDWFWSLVGACLQPGGRFLFVDDAHRRREELAYGPESTRVRRRLNDGSEYQIVKVPYRPQALERRIAALGWEVTVKPTPGPFYWGFGRRP